MKKSEALQKIKSYSDSLSSELSFDEKMALVLNFIEQEKIMLPPPEYQSKEGVAYGCEWEKEDSSEE